MKVQFTSNEPMLFPLITSSAQLDAEEKAGDMTESDLGILVNCPIIGVGEKVGEDQNGQGDNNQGGER